MPYCIELTFCTVTAVPFRVALLYCLHHVKEETAMWQAKMSPPSPSSRGYSSHATLSAEPAAVPKWRHLGVAEDIYWGQYQMAHNIFTHQHQDLLMQELHDKLNQWLVRAGLHSATCSDRSQSRGRACSHAYPHLKLSWHHQRPAGMKALQPHSSMGAALCIPVKHSPQAPYRAGSASVLPQLPSTHCQYMSTAFPLLALKSPTSNCHERVHWWGTLTPHVGAHTVGADNSSRVSACYRVVQCQVRHVPRLPPGVLPGHHAPSLEMSGYITLPTALNGSHTNKSCQGKELAWPNWESLQHALWGAHSHCRNGLKHAYPRVPHRSRCDLISWAWMIWVIHQLSTNLAGFLEQPEDATDYWCDAQRLPAPVMPSDTT